MATGIFIPDHNSTLCMRDVSVIEIDLSALDHNMRVLREIVGDGCELCPIVKADAYGLGAARIGQRLAFNGAELLAVYTPDQAAELFRAAVGARVLVLMPVRDIARVDELYRGLVSDRLQLTVHDSEHVGDLAAIADRYGVTIAVHLEVDTGMSRGGCSLGEAPSILKRIVAAKRLRLAGLFTHFASAESDVKFTDKQMASFDRLLREQAGLIPPECRVHAASSFATLRDRKYHKTMVRIGLAWAGYGVDSMRGKTMPAAKQLRPIVSWKSCVVHIKHIAAGTPVGYGSTWTATRPSIIGLIPVGYADGYPSGCSEASICVLTRARGVVSRCFAPVVGAINMDQITVDLTDAVNQCAAAGESIGVGTPVELISADPKAPNHLPKLAAMAGTIPHEMLCRLSPRLKRIYHAPVAIERSVAEGVLVG